MPSLWHGALSLRLRLPLGHGTKSPRRTTDLIFGLETVALRVPGLPETGSPAVLRGSVSTVNHKCLEATTHGALFCFPFQQLFREAGDKVERPLAFPLDPPGALSLWGLSPAVAPELAEPWFPQM